MTQAEILSGLKRAIAGDQARVEAFQKQAYARTQAVINAPAIPLEWDYDEIMRDCEVWLDERDGQLAGVLILRVLEDALFLESIGTAPEFSGSGVGRRLMDATFERAQALGRSRVDLITNSRNPAADWYQKIGFVVSFEEVRTDRKVLHMQADATGRRA